MNVITRAADQRRFEAAGFSGRALDLVTDAAAPERHRSRVFAAVRAAEEWVLARLGLARDEVSPDLLALQAGAVLVADVIGVGGRGGLEGFATRRHPALAGCGKGRKQANDGGAWDAAILEAAERLVPDGRFEARPNGWLVFASASKGETVAVDLLPDGHYEAVCGNGLLVIAGLCRRGWNVIRWYAGSPQDWSRLFDGAASAAPEAVSA